MKTNWKLLHAHPEVHLNGAFHEYHRLSQLIAMAGNDLIEPRADDSHTSMTWSHEKQQYRGEAFPQLKNARFIIQPENMEISLVDESENQLGSFSPIDLLKHEALENMNQILKEAGTKDQIKNELHFQIPEDLGAKYQVPSNTFLLEHLYLRHNADLILKSISEKHDSDSEIRIWPHHFDTGSIIYINEDDIKSTIGIGLAIADAYYPSPYFYINFHSNSEKYQDLELPKLNNSSHLNTLDWKGYILGLDEIVKLNEADDQHKIVEKFFDESIEAIRKLLPSVKGFV